MYACAVQCYGAETTKKKIRSQQKVGSSFFSRARQRRALMPFRSRRSGPDPAACLRGFAGSQYSVQVCSVQTTNTITQDADSSGDDDDNADELCARALSVEAVDEKNFSFLPSFPLLSCSVCLLPLLARIFLFRLFSSFPLVSSCLSPCCASSSGGPAVKHLAVCPLSFSFRGTEQRYVCSVFPFFLVPLHQI